MTQEINITPYTPGGNITITDYDSTGGNIVINETISNIVINYDAIVTTGSQGATGPTGATGPSGPFRSNRPWR